MNQFQQRSPAKDRVSGREGFINGTWTQEGAETKYQLLHLNGEGDRTLTWVPESQIELLAPGDLPPFDYPYVGDGSTPPGGPG